MKRDWMIGAALLLLASVGFILSTVGHPRWTAEQQALHARTMKADLAAEERAGGTVR